MKIVGVSQTTGEEVNLYLIQYLGMTKVAGEI